ncbi:MAG TPA: N-acyl homoserine lactonase family protein [Geminicoccus sp.]|jgi:glyoxylase-like metal-dependent hydrolase (beta-lactamase superfamily II)|uniref:N-acyl homoserine lactonase family protein n=1 Tax=Geminicoccus sp. TaxID=2024832 RepID=UPI002E2F511C|nr:N-acyl homoserine lactonase family protein [Geminicoccus sp.]HEX2527975.1 N-acyl homoserine lactonase family protein [Geminicoccus sp.]
MPNAAQNPAQPPQWDIYVIEYARAKDQPIASLVNGTHHEGVMDTPFSFVLARSGQRNVLVDTGFMREGIGEEMSVRFGVPYWISPVRMLEEMGVPADSVTDIVLSHAHFDHMGSIHKFPKARLYIQKSELLSWHEAMALPPQFGFLTDIINPDDLRAAFDASVEHRLTLLDGDKDNLLPGLHVRLGSGHTIGQQFVILESARGRIVVSGDCIYSSRNLTGHNHNGVYVPLANGIGSIWEQLKTMDRINDEIGGDLSKLIILHDAARWEHLPEVKNIEGFKISRAS